MADHPGRIHIALTAVVYAAVLACVMWRSAPPAPREASAAPEVFSAGRALEQMRAVLGELPHPVGSEANRAVKARLVEGLTELGYEPRIEASTMCSQHGLCAPVENIVATIGEGPDVLVLMAHYDSVAAGPGIGDDGSGVGVLLELARVLKLRPAPGNTIALLLTDGEEAGLLGAELFVTRDPLATRVRAAINVEARGSRGPSLMFETSGPTAPLAELLAELPRPATSSLFSYVYERMPNDTDFTWMKRSKVPGFNFAFIEGFAHYHTPRDAFDNLDRGSVQHHGDNALALIDALAAAPLEKTLSRRDEAVWFDFLTLTVVRWPKGWSFTLAFLALAMLLGSAIAARPRMDRKAVGVTALVTLGCVVAAVAIGSGFALGLEATEGSPMPRTSRLALPVACLAAVAAASVLALGALRSSNSPAERYAGVWLVWAVLGCVVAVLLPEACYLFVAPSLVAGAVGLASSRTDEAMQRHAALVPAFVAACMWMQVCLGLVHGVGFMGHPAITATCALAFIPALPAIDVRGVRPPAVALGLAACAWMAAVLVPTYDRDSPQRMSIVHRQDDKSAAWWVDTSWGPPSEALRSAAALTSESAPPLPWAGYARTMIGSAPRHDMPAPTAVPLDDAALAQVGTPYRLSTLRDADVLGIAVSRSCSSIRVDDALGMPYRTRQHVLFGIVLGGRKAVDVALGNGCGIEAVFDVTRGLPPFGDALLAARGDAAVPSHDGDLTVVWSAWK